MLFFWTITSLIVFCDGFKNSSFPKGLNQNPNPLPVSGNSRIVGGTLTTIQKYPFSVSLQHEYADFIHGYIHFCTGSIINENWLITSAQCYLVYNLEVCQARVGTSIYYEGGRVYAIEQVVVHPLFDENTNDYDIALVKLNDTLEYSPEVRPITLPNPSATLAEDAYITVAGWGMSSFQNGEYVEQLSEGNMTVITDELCESVYGNGSITAQMFCTYEEDVGPCFGDNGAPAMADGVMIGMASWSWGCAAPGYPSVFLNMPSVMEWITEETGVTGSSSGTMIFPFFAGILISLSISMNFSC